MLVLVLVLVLALVALAALVVSALLVAVALVVVNSRVGLWDVHNDVQQHRQQI